MTDRTSLGDRTEQQIKAEWERLTHAIDDARRSPRQNTRALRRLRGELRGVLRQWEEHQAGGESQ